MLRRLHPVTLLAGVATRLGHDHVGHMARGRRWQVCAPGRGGCGQVWRVTPDAVELAGVLIPEGIEPF